MKPSSRHLGAAFQQRPAHTVTARFALLNAGVTSRRLAHDIGRTAAAQGIDSEGLRRWLTGLHLDGWRNQFSATRYEVNNLLEYVRTRRSSMVGALSDADRGSLEVDVPLHRHRHRDGQQERVPHRAGLRGDRRPRPAFVTCDGAFDDEGHPLNNLIVYATLRR